MNKFHLFAMLLLCPATVNAIQVERLRSLGGRPLAGDGIEVVVGEVLVRFDPAVNRSSRETALAAIGAGIIRELSEGTHVLLPAGMAVSDGLTRLAAVPGVLAVQPNHVYHVSKVPNDPLFWSQYQFEKINSPQAWDDEDGATAKVTIAVLDSGIEGSHPELSGKMVGVSQFCNPGDSKLIGGDNTACGAEPSGGAVAACNHGTRVAGVATAGTNNNFGVSGVSWGAQLISLRVFRTQDCTSSCGDGTGQICATDDTAIISAIDYARTVLAVAPGVFGRVVVNTSLGESIACSGLLDTAITNAVAAGVVFIASAGNDGGAVDAPGNCTDAFPVGATDSLDQLASFSSRGAEMTARGVVAPGVKLLTTTIGGGVTSASDLATGTSFSAPIVAGLSALLLSENAALTPLQVRTHIRNGADSIGLAATSQGAGRVNACKAIKLAQGVPVGACSNGSALAGFVVADPVVAFPNPFRANESSGVTIKLPVSFHGKSPAVTVHTMEGQPVRTLQPFTTTAFWDGKNTNGTFVASGVYIIMVKAGSDIRRFKLAFIH